MGSRSLPVLVLVLSVSLRAQTTAALSGTILDPSGAPVANAALEATESKTLAVRTAVSDGQGRYLIPGMTPGIYRLDVRSTGFRAVRQDAVELTAGQAVRADFHLVLGVNQEAIEVHATAPLLSANAADWGNTLRGDMLKALPLNGRDIWDLMLQQPGVVAPGNASHSALSYGVGQRVAINGLRPKQNTFRLDGVQINDATANAPASAAGRSLGLEGIAEIAVITSPFSAEYGRASGGVVAAVTRSGGNDWHGSAYEYLRNSALDAKNFFDALDAPIPAFRRNQYGGLVSGPAVKNRLFFVLNYEALRETRGRTSSSAVPTADARQGRIPTTAGGVAQVPVAAQVRPYLNLYPLPNGRNFGDGTGEYIAANPTSTQEDYGSAKVDAVITPRLRLSARYTGDGSQSSITDPYGLWDFLYVSRYHTLHTDLQFLQSPRTIHNFRLGYTRVRNGDVADAGRLPAELAFVPGQQMGTIQVTGLTELGGTRARSQPQTQALHNLQGSWQSALIRGAHSLKIGGGFERQTYDRGTGTLRVGTYVFDSLTNFLQARSRSGEVVLPGGSTDLNYRQDLYHLFAQDEIRLHPRLSLSLGIRYEPYSTLRETAGNAISIRLPIETAVIAASGPAYRNPSHANFAPRAGLAWNPTGDGRTVIRAGGGVFYDLLGSALFSPSRGFGPPSYQRVAVTAPAFPNLLNAATGASARPSFDTVDFDANQPAIYQWQVQAQRQFNAAATLQVGYVASRGTHLTGFVGSVNPARPQVLAGGELFFPATALRLNPDFDRVSLSRTQFNQFHHGLVTQLDQRMRRGLRLQVRYTFARTIDETSGDVFRDYNSMDFMPNLFDYRSNRGLSDYHVGHVFGMNGSWLVPSPGPGAWRTALGGWELHGMFQAQTGSPFNPRTGFDRARLQATGTTGDLGQRPDLAVAGAPAILGGPDRYFDASIFALPDAGTFGNLGRNVLTGPGLVSLDAAAHKAFRISERHAVQFRAEAFNLANHPNFQLPSSLNLFSSNGSRVGSAGRITETTTSSRQLQLALRWSF